MAVTGSKRVPCYKPLQGYHKPGGGIAFDKRGTTGIPLQVPCGRCIGCRLDRTSTWANRMVHESRFHEQNCFLTLTYDPEKYPDSGSLVKLHLSAFLKRLRRRIEPQKIRFYGCGEYGEQNLHPHYHVIIFGYFPEDAERVNSGKNPIYASKFLESVWGHGFITVGQFTPETAAYTARYVTKKITGERAEKHYQRIDPDTGEVLQVIPEFALMSRRPGIGAQHYERYTDDIYNDDFVVSRGKKYKTPSYYDRLLERDDPERLLAVKTRRRQRAAKHAVDNTPERLAVRESVTKARVGLYQRRNL